MSKIRYRVVLERAGADGFAVHESIPCRNIFGVFKAVKTGADDLSVRAVYAYGIHDKDPFFTTVLWDHVNNPQ